MTATTRNPLAALATARRLTNAVIAAEALLQAVLHEHHAAFAAEIAAARARTQQMFDEFARAAEQQAVEVMAEMAELTGQKDETQERRDALVAGNKAVFAAEATPVPSGEKNGSFTPAGQTCAACHEFVEQAAPLVGGICDGCYTARAVDRQQYVEIPSVDATPADESVLTAFTPPVEPDPSFDTVAEEVQHWERIADGRLPTDGDGELLGVPAANGKAAQEVPASQATPAGRKRNRKGQ